MPNVQYEVDQIEVEKELKARNYSIHGQSAHGIQLTVADPTKPRFKFNGAAHRRILPGVSKDAYRQIRRQSANAQEAADRIEAISNGQAVEFQPTAPVAAPALSTEVLDRIVENRVDAVIAARTAEIDRREAELREREAQAAAAVAAPPKKKAKIAAANNEPVLTDEQKEMAKQAGVPLA
jgi:hypothetical protein